jgi:signal transduction histidine kinase/CheY-like chemotaxis protein
MSVIDILIADDHEFFRQNLRSLLECQPDWRVCGEAADGIEAVEKARQLHPQIILMDMSMPRMDGAEASRTIRREIPESQVIMVSQNDPLLMRKIAAQTGAQGFVSKSDIVRDLVPAILKIINQNNHNPPAPSNPPESVPQVDWLFGGGALPSLIQRYDWSRTPLGPIQSWPQSLRTAVNLMVNSQHPIWIGWGPEKTFLYNDAYISVLSMAKHPWALGRPASEVWAEIWDVCGPLADKVFSRGEPSFADDVRLFMNRGDYLEETYYSFSYSPIYDESGKVAGLFCPSTEITSKVLNARRLRTLSELSSKSLIEKTTEGACASCVNIISQNPDDIPFSLLYLIDAEKQAANLSGNSHVSAGLDRVSPLTIALDGETKDLLWPIRELIDGAEPCSLSFERIDSLPLGAADQRVREAMVLPVTSLAMERPVGVLIAGVNPTRELDAEYRTFFSLVADQVATALQNTRALQQEKERADALAEIDRAKTMFFSNVSHEFRTPLTLMLAPLEDMLVDSADLVPRQRERLDIAHRNSLRLLKLVNTLLDFSRIESGRIQASYEPVDLSKLTSDLASVFRSAVERGGVRFTIDCPHLGEPVYVDSEMWEKIVFNLLSNAFKFTFAGEIEISLRKRGNNVELSVRDSGTGIPATDLPHLFERFYRVKGAQGRTFEGSGIGLALIQDLTKLHGGAVRVESELNRGSTFIVSIPLGKDHLPPDRIGAAHTLASTGLNAEPIWKKPCIGSLISRKSCLGRFNLGKFNTSRYAQPTRRVPRELPKTSLKSVSAFCSPTTMQICSTTFSGFWLSNTT